MQTEKEYLIGREINALRCESVGEYSLPDYNGDVRKILAVKTKVSPTGKFVGDDSLEFSGTIGYEVVYLDGENSVTHADFSTDYEAAVKINADAYVDSDVETSVSGFNMRLVGPRKFSVKCSLDNDVRISERRVYEIAGDAFEEYEPEISVRAVRVFSPTFHSGDAKDISEQITDIDGAIADEVEILMCDAAAEVDGTDKREGTAELRGNVRVTLLYRNGDDVPRAAVKEIAFSEELPLDDVGACASLEPRVELREVKSSVTPTDDGVSLGVSMSLTPKIYCRKNSELDLVYDAYLKERGTVNEYADFGYTEHICTERAEDDFEAKRPLSELGIENFGDVIYSEAIPRVESCEFEGEGVKIRGEIKFSGIACQVSEDGSPNYFPVKLTAPFEQNVNVSCQKHDNMRINCDVHARDAKIDLDENGVCASCTLDTSLAINSERRQRCLGASDLTDEEYSRDESVITVYYPDSTESLFGIAKRFHTSVSAIAESNRLAEAVFASSDAPVGAAGVKKLIIK